LYEAVSGQRAFPGEDAIAVATRITTDDPPAVAAYAGLDPHVDDVLSRGLAKIPGARFEDARAFGRALAEALGHSPRMQLPTIPDGRHRNSAPSAQESRTTRLVLGGAAIGALLGIAGFQLSMGLREPEHPPEPRAEQVTLAQPSRPEAALPAEPPPKKPKPAKKDGVRDAGALKAPRATAFDAGAPRTGDGGNEQVPPP
jgi:serine/threonine-protein kinase